MGEDERIHISSVPWTDEERETLRKLYPHLGVKISMEDIMNVLTRRTRDAIDKQARKLELTNKRTLNKERINKEYLKQLEEVIEY